MTDQYMPNRDYSQSCASSSTMFTTSQESCFFQDSQCEYPTEQKYHTNFNKQIQTLACINEYDNDITNVDDLLNLSQDNYQYPPQNNNRHFNEMNIYDNNQQFDYQNNNYQYLSTQPNNDFYNYNQYQKSVEQNPILNHFSNFDNQIQKDKQYNSKQQPNNHQQQQQQYYYSKQQQINQNSSQKQSNQNNHNLQLNQNYHQQPFYMQQNQQNSHYQQRNQYPNYELSQNEFYNTNNESFEQKMNNTIHSNQQCETQYLQTNQNTQQYIYQPIQYNQQQLQQKQNQDRKSQSQQYYYESQQNQSQSQQNQYDQQYYSHQTQQQQINKQEQLPVVKQENLTKSDKLAESQVEIQQSQHQFVEIQQQKICDSQINFDQCYNEECNAEQNNSSHDLQKDSSNQDSNQTQDSQIKQNIYKSIMNAFKQFLGQKQKICALFQNKEKIDNKLKQLARFLKTHSFNHQVLKYIALHETYSIMFSHFMNNECEKWLSKSKIVKKDIAISIIKYLQQCIIDKNQFDDFICYKTSKKSKKQKDFKLEDE